MKFKSIDEIIEACRVPENKRIRLQDYDPAWAGDPDLPKKERREFAENLLSQDVSSLAEAQERLYAADGWSVLVIFQALDAAGKDGTIKHVMSGINPQGCQVYSFKHPSAEELEHNFLWRCTKALPERGRIGIFNRSYYEEVLIVRVHPELVAAQRIPGATATPAFWDDRYDDINRFERHLTRNGTAIVKFFLNVSKDEQRRRFLERLENPEKHWKFSASDLAERAHWEAYQAAYEAMINATSTKQAPWYVVPADNKWVTRAIVAKVLTRTLDSLNLRYPEISDAQRAAISEAREQLKRETPA